MKYVDPDGQDIREASLYSFSVGVFGAARLSVGIARDSNDKTAIFIKVETGVGFGGSLAKLDKVLPTLNTVSSFITDLQEDLDAIDTTMNNIPDTGKGNLTGQVTKTDETIFDWTKNGQSMPVEAAVIVGAEGDKDGNTKITVGATAIANIYLREDTVYIDITKATDFLKEKINKTEEE